jgi:hypothetical protein
MASTNVYKVYQDDDFTAADSPVVLDISTDLETISGNGEKQYANSLGVTNTGKYDIAVEISMDGTTYGDSQILSSKSTDNINSAGVKKLRITHQGNDTGYQVKAYSRVVGDAMLGNGGTNASVIDDDTEPIDTYFAESLGQFTLSADTVASGLTAGTLVYTFEATAGHGLVATDQINLIAEDRSFIAYVVNVAVNTITVDTPIDYVFEAATAVGLIINTNLAVAGSLASPRIFKVQAGVTPVFFRRFILTITDGSAMDDGKFGGIPALTNGLVLRIVNGFQKSIINVKTNSDLRQWAFDLQYADKAPAGVYGVSSRLTYAGKEKHGVVLSVSGTSEVQWVVQDDLTDLLTLFQSAMGNKK